MEEISKLPDEVTLDTVNDWQSHGNDWNFWVRIPAVETTIKNHMKVLTEWNLITNRIYIRGEESPNTKYQKWGLTPEGEQLLGLMKTAELME